MRSKPGAIVIAIVILGLLWPLDVRAEFDVPDGFSDELVVGGLPSPTSIAWLPQGENRDLLITTQGGVLFRWDGDGAAESVLDLSGTICAGGETGLLGLAVDPQFEAGDRFVYLYYTDRQGNGSCGNSANRANRVSRFTMDNQDNLEDERVLIDNISARGGNHNGGDLQFGNDGLLYISVGDGGEDLRTGGGQDSNGNARRLDLLNGKILRIEPNGGIPDGNPFQGSGTARCSATGSLERQGDKVNAEKKSKKQKRRAKMRKRENRRNREPATRCQEIFATGLRNPFRIAFDPDDNQRFFINDVGGDGFEEVNEGLRGGNYGWNIREGPCPINEIAQNCSPDNRFEEPVFAYRRDGSPPFDGCRTITGGAFVPDSADWPGLDDVYLFADLFCGRIFELRDEQSGSGLEIFASGEGAGHLAFGPDRALYYTALFDGEVHKIVFAS